VTPVPRLFQGWVIVAGAFVVLFMAYGTQFAFGVFFAALLDDFQWSRARLAGAFSLYTVTYSLCAFLAGRLTDRWGPRAVISLGGALLGVGLAGMGGIWALWQPYVLYGTVAAFGMSTAYVPCSATVVKWFVRRRGLAVGLASSGGSLGAFVLPPLAQLLVTQVGWRWAYVIFGAAIFFVLTLVARHMRGAPEDVGLFPDGAATAESLPTDFQAAWPLARALRTRTFWMLFAVFAATWIPVFIPVVHAVSFARDLGFSPLTASSLVSALGIGAVAGRLGMGAASDRIGRTPALALGLALQALAFAALSLVTALGGLYVAAFAFGFSYGSISSTAPAIVGDFFGREQAGTLFGFLFAFAGSLAAVGPILAGAIHDARGTYGPAFALGALLNVTALGLVLGVRPPRPAAQARTEATVVMPSPESLSARRH
jgi:MFS family permease